MLGVDYGHWILGALLVIFTSVAFFTRHFRRTAMWLGLSGVALSVLYYVYFFSFWPLLYFLVYLIVFMAFLLMALTFPEEALRDDALERTEGAETGRQILKGRRAWPYLLKWAGGILLGLAAAWAIINLMQALGSLPPAPPMALKAEEYFIDLAVLSIFLLVNVVGLIFIFGPPAERKRNEHGL